MAWPTSTINTSNLDAATDSPASARPDLLAAVQAVNLMIGHGGLPVGTLLPFAGTAAPSGFLLCDGSAVSRSTYADLFAAIGTSWGAGNGSTTFNLPDMRERVPMGRSAAPSLMASNFAGNTTAGSNFITLATYTNAGRGMTVTGPGIPAGTTITDIGPSSVTLSANATATQTLELFTARIIDAATVGATGGRATVRQTVAELPPHSHTVAALATLNPTGGGSTTMAYQGGAATMTSSTVGTGAALHLVQPSAVVTYIIKA